MNEVNRKADGWLKNHRDHAQYNVVVFRI